VGAVLAVAVLAAAGVWFNYTASSTIYVESRNRMGCKVGWSALRKSLLGGGASNLDGGGEMECDEVMLVPPNVKVVCMCSK
jgi:hypothetical protein